MKDNIQLFEISLNNKEPYLDKYYVKNNKPIITDNSTTLNSLMRANANIIENISAYKIALESGNYLMQNTTLQNILKYLEEKNVNLTEFTNYWATKDMSYSVYNKTLSSKEEKLSFLRKIVPEYLKDRHLLYQTHGYSFSTIQVINDSKAHKKNGEAGIKKISDILINFGFKHFNENDLKTFLLSDKVFIYPDKTEKKLFNEIIHHYDIKFEWSKNHENKKTDFLFKVNKQIFIMEHKHMKETGGGQDKQMSEIINFIQYQDQNAHYVSFLDGVYFNLLANKEIISGKPFEQRNAIFQNLKVQKNNYFVNTLGFNELIKDLIK